MVTPNSTLACGLEGMEADSVTGVELLMVPAVAVNVVEVAPAGTMTIDGTLAAVGLELVSDTTAPLVPAADVSLTIPVPD
jgi:hypothetical protein